MLKNVTGFCRFSVNCRDDSLAAADSVRDGVFFVDPVDGVCDILLCVGPFSYLIFNYLD